MTKNQYIIAKILSKIGIKRTQKRLLAAANELQLLKEAQDVLGRKVWSNLREHKKYQEIAETIDQLTIEKNELGDKAETLQVTINSLNKKQSHLTITTPGQATAVAEIKAQKANIKAEATAIKHKHDEAKRKVEAIKAAGDVDPFQLEQEEEKMAMLKATFVELKVRKAQADKQLLKLQKQINPIAKDAPEAINSTSSAKAEQFRRLGEKNKEMSTILSRSGIIDNKINALHGNVGKMISFQALDEPKFRKAIKENYGLCKVMRAIRRSVKYNHSLTGRT